MLLLKKLKITLLIFVVLCALVSNTHAQKPYRVGTVTANFLEIGYGATANSMGDAFVSVANDLSSIYWNPAGLATLKNNGAHFEYQPWLAEINTSFLATALNLGDMGTLSLGIIAVNYGDMDLTTLDYQNGTGETFTASDIAVSFGYSRKLADWFAFGAAAKYVSTSIWHTSASAFAVDLGVLINTGAFSPTAKKDDGLNIGMSVSNYGTPMQFDGQGLLQSINPTPDKEGDFDDVAGKYDLGEWELPLIFRLGISTHIVKKGNHALLIAVDALHPNNNSESVNVGGLYSILFPGVAKLSIAAGYKGLFMTDSNYGLSLGVGVESYLLYNTGYKFSYSYREHETLGGTHAYGISIYF